ncbi:hypothetical protein EFR84_11810 [Rhizobium chutanense]|uniref:Uncharacterized protein n=1 Tax=Rhizobium chutanense TaxID=2035448 RepID=A0A432P3Y1_9HYPH|nr:hypothetical protein EFR84_11810 [Rhizobium chutanense]
MELQPIRHLVGPAAGSRLRSWIDDGRRLVDGPIASINSALQGSQALTIQHAKLQGVIERARGHPIPTHQDRNHQRCQKTHSTTPTIAIEPTGTLGLMPEKARRRPFPEIGKTKRVHAWIEATSDIIQRERGIYCQQAVDHRWRSL